MKEHPVIIYTDGGCDNRAQARDGAWAFLALWRDREVEHYGFHEPTSSNQMELAGIIAALEFIKPTKHPVLLHVDSAYAMHCLTVWHHSWRRNNWISSTGTPVKNRELIERGLAAIEKHGGSQAVKFVKVKGHQIASTDHARRNNRVDELATLARKTKASTLEFKL